MTLTDEMNVTIFIVIVLLVFFGRFKSPLQNFRERRENFTVQNIPLYALDKILLSGQWKWHARMQCVIAASLAWKKIKIENRWNENGIHLNSISFFSSAHFYRSLNNNKCETLEITGTGS